MTMIDTHCHVDLYENPQHILNEVARQNILTIATTNLPSHFALGVPHVRTAKYVRLALGLHPLMVDNHTTSELQKFKNLANTTSYIGEVGLDYSREGRNTATQQVKSFRFVLDCIKNRPRFITIHSRGAEADVLSLLSEYKIPGAVFHWYSGPLSLIDKVVAAGHYFSFNPAMVGAAKGRTIIERVPTERILTETDGPYVSINKKVVTPADVTVVLTHLAAVWSVSKSDAEEQVWHNFQTIVASIKASPHGSISQ